MNLLYITFLIFHKMDAFVLETRHMMNNTCIAMLYFIYSHLVRSLLLVLYYATLILIRLNFPTSQQIDRVLFGGPLPLNSSNGVSTHRSSLAWLLP